MSDAVVIEVVRKTVTVDCAVEEAFRSSRRTRSAGGPSRRTRSTERTSARSSSSRTSAARSTRSRRPGDHGHWATVLEWEPPNRLVLAWNILSARVT